MFKSHLEYCWTILLVSQTLVYVCMCCTVVRMWQLFDNLILCAMCIRFCGITMQQRRWEMRFSVDNCDTFEMVYSCQRNSTTFSASTLHYIPIFFFSQPQYVSTLQHFSMHYAPGAWFFSVDSTQSEKKSVRFWRIWHKFPRS